MTSTHTLLLLFLALATTGCVSLIRPNYTQQITELRKGAYTLDDEHAYLNFKVEHLGLSFAALVGDEILLEIHAEFQRQD